ncbi:MAG: EAL domain-containing protein [Stenomitos rutilans HA7619-LM2]|jgi:EAL domain-containing protein (putative c-di-GMP-specific phosphodiesterase class I)|nr:EAL domain-containing protein [Stenomitos rutilans HA7619-LM2]MBW4469407.1 EAL domain-containing protein [Stenomitos rutilans HA7619-LM2]
MFVTVSHPLTWNERIETAIASSALVFYCQPIYKCGHTTPSLYEVLVRLRGADKEVIPACQFINEASAEQLKAIDRLAVIGTLKHLQQTDTPHAINLSGHTLNDLQFPVFLSEQLQKSGVDPRKLDVEITEQTALLPLSVQVIAALRELRLAVGLDDIGSGYAAIPAILAVAPDFIKADGSIVRLLATDHWRECIVYGIMAGAHHRGLKLILECIESGLIESRALELAEDFPGLKLYFQGWLYGRPEPCLN